VPFSLNEARNILPDRCSAYWAIDESIGMWHCKNVAMACALAEGLYHEQARRELHGTPMDGELYDHMPVH